MKILVTADIHIGRRSSRIREHLGGSQFSCAEAWRRIVALAIDQGVDLVAVAGDLIDRENRYFEAYGPLEWGLARLAEAGVDVAAVAGNHDHDLLERLDRTLTAGRFHLLGLGGRWEKTTVDRPSGETLDLLGWSFPREHVSENPMHTFDFAPGERRPVIGILHTDLGQTGSRYAPCTVDELSAPDLDMWILGHGHKPEPIDTGAGPVILNPGSPQAMDPGETGPHGVWIVKLEPGRRPEPERVPLSTARYDNVEVDVDGLVDVEEVKTRLIQTVRDRLEEASGEAGPLELLSHRLRITGRTPLHHNLDGQLRDMVEEFELTADRVTAVVEKIVTATRPAVDIEELARGQSPPALLARLLLDLEAGSLSRDRVEFLQEIQEKTAAVYRAKPYTPLMTDPEPDADGIRELLLRQGRLLLDALLAQKESA